MSVQYLYKQTNVQLEAGAVASQQTFVGLQDMSWRCLQQVFGVTILRLPRRLEGVFKTSWKTKNCYAEDVLKMSWRHVLKTPWGYILKTSSRRLGGKQIFYWWYLYLTNLNVYLTNLCFINIYLTNLRRIHNASLRTQ